MIARAILCGMAMLIPAQSLAQPVKNERTREILQMLPDETLGVLLFRHESGLLNKTGNLVPSTLDTVGLSPVRKWLADQKISVKDLGIKATEPIVIAAIEVRGAVLPTPLVLVPVVDYQQFERQSRVVREAAGAVVFPALGGNYAALAEAKTGETMRKLLETKAKGDSCFTQESAWLAEQDVAACFSKEGIRFYMRLSGLNFPRQDFPGKADEKRLEAMIEKFLGDPRKGGQAWADMEIHFGHMALLLANVRAMSFAARLDAARNIRLTMKVTFTKDGTFAQVAANAKAGQRAGAALPDVSFVFAAEENFSVEARKAVVPFATFGWSPLVNYLEPLLHWRRDFSGTSLMVSRLGTEQKDPQVRVLGAVRVKNATDRLKDLANAKKEADIFVNGIWRCPFPEKNFAVKALKSPALAQDAVQLDVKRQEVATSVESSPNGVEKVHKKFFTNIQSMTGFLVRTGQETIAFALATKEEEAKELLKAARQNGPRLLDNPAVKKTVASLPSQAEALFLVDWQQWRELTSPGKQVKHLPKAPPIGGTIRFVPEGAELQLLVPAELLAALN